jgi:hypothetical protein
MRKVRGERIGKAWACHLEGSIPAEWQVLVLADRGLSARWLFQAIGARVASVLALESGSQSACRGAGNF